MSCKPLGKTWHSANRSSWRLVANGWPLYPDSSPREQKGIETLSLLSKALVEALDLHLQLAARLLKGLALCPLVAQGEVKPLAVIREPVALPLEIL